MSTIDAIYEILEQKGTAPEKMAIEETYTIKRDGFEDLIIEKIADDRISVGQYYTQNRDLMSDPEIVFKITDSGLVPIRYTHHPYVHQTDRSGLAITDFLQTWEKNLRRQGFVEAAQAGGEA